MDNYSDIEDTRRRDSETRFRNHTNSKYLQDVIDRTSKDHDETLKFLECRRKSLNDFDNAFLESMGRALRDETLDDPTGAETVPSHLDDAAVRKDVLVAAADRLLKLHREASYAVSEFSEAASGLLTFRQRQAEDRQRVKELLEAGKRVVERECYVVQRDAEADESTAGKEELAAQAMTILGLGSEKHVDCRVESLGYMQKGVKKMTKALRESEP